MFVDEKRPRCNGWECEIDVSRRQPAGESVSAKNPRFNTPEEVTIRTYNGAVDGGDGDGGAAEWTATAHILLGATGLAASAVVAIASTLAF